MIHKYSSTKIENMFISIIKLRYICKFNILRLIWWLLRIYTIRNMSSSFYHVFIPLLNYFVHVMIFLKGELAFFQRDVSCFNKFYLHLCCILTNFGHDHMLKTHLNKVSRQKHGKIKNQCMLQLKWKVAIKYSLIFWT